MKCSKARRELRRSDTGDLSAELRSHLEGCAECHRAWRKQRKLEALLAPRDQEGPSRDLWSEITVKLKAGSPAAMGPGASQGRQWKQGLALAGAALAIMVAALVLWPAVPTWEEGETWVNLEDPATEMVWEDPWAGGAPEALFTALQERG